MYRHTKAGLAMLLTGALLASTVIPAFAEEGGPGVVGGSSSTTETSSGISLSGPGGDAPQGAQETAESSSGVITAGESTEGSSETDGTTEGTTGSSQETPGVPGTSDTSAQTTSPDGSAASSETNGFTDGQNAALTEQQGAELEAEKAQAEAEASHLNNPLVVPDREAHLQTTILLNDAQAWSQAYVNDQQIEGAAAGFSSISTFLENIHGNVLYRTYSSVNGWTAWALNGQQTANATTWVPVEAIQYRFSGPVADKYDIYYSTILSDGTRTGWAKNGESAGTMNQGLYITGFRLAFFVKGTAELDTTNVLVSAHQDGIQMVDGVMQYIHGDGSGYTGWGWQQDDRYYFVDSMPVTGWQYIDGFKYYFQEDGRLLQDVEPIIGTGGPFMLKINKEMNCLTVYAKDGDNGFIIPVKSFLTSVGDDTPIGTFRTPEKYRWRLMIHDLYTQYATRLGAGMPILIHSIIYDAPNPFTVWASTYNNLGIARSAGCIRLASADAKWVYDNCAIGTTVVVYNSSIAGPFERPTIMYEIPFEQTWDPTDPNVTQEMIDAETARIIAKFNP
ncbi:L,D-transpeptidase family protein [Clostridium sp. AN503]|uniref:L,D-transpeptidase n=1 Tax=Clostridium sp. AN503 TaxID=3160598 RepID=UPI003458E2D7